MLLLFRGDVGGQLFCGLGQQHPLRLFHDPALQGFRRVAGQNVHRFLQQDAPPVRDLVHQMDGSAGDPDATAEDVFLQLIARARQTVYITTPYLAIDEPMIKALCVAGDSGVDVRLMMPGIPDHWFAYQVAQSYFPELAGHHVKIYTFTPGLIHGKTVMVDREAAFVGSVNMDFRSFQLHFECGELLYRMPAIESLLEDMDNIIQNSQPVTPARMAARPWYLRVVGVVLRLFAMWM